jgi:hypothetical protein
MNELFHVIYLSRDSINRLAGHQDYLTGSALSGLFTHALGAPVAFIIY